MKPTCKTFKNIILLSKWFDVNAYLCRTFVWRRKQILFWYLLNGNRTFDADVKVKCQFGDVRFGAWSMRQYGNDTILLLLLLFCMCRCYYCKCCYFVSFCRVWYGNCLGYKTVSKASVWSIGFIIFTDTRWVSTTFIINYS